MKFFTAKEIKPRGWLKRQLEIQAAGLSGHLDQMWPDVADSKWIGGEHDGWERVPYWLDGFIPLAYLLEDEDLIARAKKYVDAILARQCEDGWLCPCAEDERKKYDTWPLQLISKTLLVYYECSGDERIPEVLYRALKNYHQLLKEKKVFLFKWSKYRWFETFIALNFLRERGEEPFMRELAQLLDEQGFDYRKASFKWERPLNRWTYQTHVVNLGMMLKYGAVTDELLDGKYHGVADELYDTLMQYNGTPVGIFTGDECLSGLSPVQGTELCAVAELMYSCELLYAHTGDSKWANVLEKLAFNAMPATVSDDMWTHQYVQMANQICCKKFPGKSIFRTNGPEAHLFGLEPNFGCCTANFNQAFPKFALSTFLQDGEDVVSVSPVPSALRAEGISIDVEGGYPFRNGATYTVLPGKAFTLKLRVPAGAKNVTVNGVPMTGELLSLPVEADTAYTFVLEFDREAKLTERPHGLQTVEYGSLVFSLPISYTEKRKEYTKNGVERKFPYCDYEYIGQSDWKFGYASETFAVEEREIGETPFSSKCPPLVLKAKVAPVDWEYADGFDTVAAKLPSGREAIGEAREVLLYPYGCAKLRMTELPFVGETAEKFQKKA